MRVLCDIGDRFCDDIVDRRLDCIGQPRVWDPRERDRDGRTFGKRPESGGQTAVAENGWVDAARELAQFSERLLEIVLRDLDERFRRLGVSPQARPDQLQLECERDEPLLCPVVQVSLQPSAFGVGCFDDPRS